jgi:hypothetical protein
VHLLLQPHPQGSGLQFESDCPTDILEGHFQHLVLTHLAEKTHLGVLTGSPITDIKITLMSGRAHEKHTEGGDFRQATYRAVRQGLMQAKSVLLEPWYNFILTVPTAVIGRAITDIRAMFGQFDTPENEGEFSVLRGTVPASELGDYAQQVAAYTQGKGMLQVSLQGYAPCHDAQKVIEEMKPRLIVHANRQSMYYWGIKKNTPIDLDANDYENPWMGYKVKRVTPEAYAKLPECMQRYERWKLFPLYEIVGFVDSPNRINRSEYSETSLKGSFLMEYVMGYRKKEDQEKMYKDKDWQEIWGWDPNKSHE